MLFLPAYFAKKEEFNTDTFDIDRALCRFLFTAHENFNAVRCLRTRRWFCALGTQGIRDDLRLVTASLNRGLQASPLGMLGSG